MFAIPIIWQWLSYKAKRDSSRIFHLYKALEILQKRTDHMKKRIFCTISKHNLHFLTNKCWVRSFIANDKTDFFNKSPSFLKRQACSSFQWDVVAWPIWGFLLHSKALIASPCWNYAAQKKETEQLLRKRNGSIIIDWMLALAQKICLALVMLTCQRSSLSDKSFGTNVQTKKEAIPPNP